MPDPDRLLRTLHRAGEAFDATPGLIGRTVRLADADEVLAAGDLHGNVENFRRLLACAALDTHPRRHFVLQELIHGPYYYPAGGDKSHQLVDLVAALKVQYPGQVHLLLGNHELAQWTGQWIAKENLELTQCFREGVDSAYGVRAEEIYEAYLKLFQKAALAVRTPNGVLLCHSLPSARRLKTFDPGVLESESFAENHLGFGGNIHSLLWGRDTSLATARSFLNLVGADLLVTGHIPCEQGFDVPNELQVILDSLGAPAAYCLFPANETLSHAELVQCIKLL
jgi:hypothetical protein